MLHVYPNVYASGSVPKEWKPIRGGTLKYPVRNRVVRRYLQKLSDGKRQKVIKQADGGDVHYFEHASGQVAGVKFFSS
ncbi:MAG: hypothetical protein ACREX9_21110 [Gammaproteobacteria bacterium]